MSNVKNFPLDRPVTKHDLQDAIVTAYNLHTPIGQSLTDHERANIALELVRAAVLVPFKHQQRALSKPESKRALARQYTQMARGAIALVNKSNPGIPVYASWAETVFF